MTRADEPLWSPSGDRAATTNVDRFIEATNSARGLGLDGFEALHEWSLADPGGFWAEVWSQFGVVGEPGSMVVEPGDDLPATRFFSHARLNFAENLLRRRGAHPAMVSEDEAGRRRQVSWDELHGLVSRLQQAMQAAGVGLGDRVAAWLPNTPDTYAVMLAAASLGAVFSSTSPDFGADGVVDRFGQIEPTLLLATDGYHYGGRRHDCLDRLARIRAELPTVRSVVLVPDDPTESPSVDGTVGLADFLAPHQPAEVMFERLPFDHPLYVLYSSGTTGPPKCIIHRAGGILVKHLVEQRLHCDVRPGDRVFYFTTAGWMMWNWLASALASEATLVLYDGAPFEPSPARLFDLADDVGVTLFGTSAKYLDAVAKSGLRPVESHDLSTLRTMCSTGSPLVPEGFQFVYDSIASDVHLASISGGTDLCGCLVAGDPTSSVWPGEIQRPALGLDIDVLGPDGRPADPGAGGELVCANPFPTMPVGFWNDPGGTRYHEAYFARYPGYWHQGDYAERTEHGGFVIHGRSDATLNPGGVRIGTAEIYRQVEQIEQVLEAIVVGQRWDSDTRTVLFVMLRDDAELDTELESKIRDRIRTGASPRHVPAVIAEVDDIPRTRSGKIVELAVRAMVHGEPVANRTALANPEALDHFGDHPALA